MEALCFSIISTELIDSRSFSVAAITTKTITAICKSRGYREIFDGKDRVSDLSCVNYVDIAITYNNKVHDILLKLTKANFIVYDENNSTYSLAENLKHDTFIKSCQEKATQLDSYLDTIKNMQIEPIDYSDWVNNKSATTTNKKRKGETELLYGEITQLQQDNKKLKTEIEQYKELEKNLNDKLGSQTELELANEQLRKKLQGFQAGSEFQGLRTEKEMLWKQLDARSQENQKLKQENLKLTEKISKLERDLQTAKTAINAPKPPVPQQQQPPAKTQFWVSEQKFQAANSDPKAQAPMVGVWSRKNRETGGQWIKNALNPKKRKADENDNNSQQTDSQTSTQKTPS